jgi:hypothetical protein
MMVMMMFVVDPMEDEMACLCPGESEYGVRLWWYGKVFWE